MNVPLDSRSLLGRHVSVCLSVLVETKLFGKTALISQSMASLVWKELTTKPRDSEKITDESIESFVSRRFSPEVASNMVDPLLKGTIRSWSCWEAD